MASRVTPSLLLAFVSLAAPALAQSVTQSALPQPTVVPVRLPHAVYSPIAQSARFHGQVTVTVDVRPDGSVASAAVVGKDIPFLGFAAVEAAKSSTFECRGCGDAPASYSIVYAFEMEGAPGPSGEVEQPPPVHESPTRSRVTTVVPAPLLTRVTASAIAVPARSVKCLWLWKCGYKV